MELRVLTDVNGAGTILVVEDDDRIRKLTLLVLRSYGYRTLEADDGKSGLATFLRHRNEVDLVVSDLVMPHSGPEMADEVLEAEPSAKIAFMSGTVSELPRHLKDLPILEKPFTANDLVRFVRQCLQTTSESVR